MEYKKWNPNAAEKEDFYNNTVFEPENYTAGIFIAEGQNLDEIDFAVWGSCKKLALLLLELEHRIPLKIKLLKAQMKVLDNDAKPNSDTVETQINHRIN